MPYVKTSARTTRAGTVRYLQLAHNEWDPGTQRSRTRVLYNFGREDELDKDAVRRLVAALSRLLDPAEALAAAEPGELPVTASRPVGGTHALDRLWRRLGPDEVIRRCLAGRDALTDSSPGPAAASASAGSSSRDSAATRRLICSLSISSSRPKLCSTLVRDRCVAGSHSLWASCR